VKYFWFGEINARASELRVSAVVFGNRTEVSQLENHCKQLLSASIKVEPRKWA
jgi:hypothetical protein